MTVELGKTIDGRRQRKTFTKKTAQEAHAAADRFTAQRLLGIVDLNDQTTVAKFTHDWLETTVAYSCRPATQENYRDIMTRYVLPKIGSMRLLDVRAVHVEKVLCEIADKGLRVNTVKNARRVMSAMFTAAYRNDMISNNPVSKTLVPKARYGEGSRKPEPLTRQEVTEVFSALQGHQFEALFVWLATTGTRRGEALGVKWSDIAQDEDGHWTAHIERQVREDRVACSDGSFTVVRTVSAPKTKTSVRTIYLTDNLIDLLEEHRKKLRFSSDGRGWNEDEFVFSTPEGEPHWPSNVTKAWTLFLKNNGFRHMQLHGLRHTFANLSLQQGAPLEAVTEALGHSSIAITKDMYAKRVKGLALKATSAYATIFPKRQQGGRGVNHWGLHPDPAMPEKRTHPRNWSF